MPAARHWFRLAWVAAALCALGTLPWLVTATSAGGWSLHAQAVAVAGVFVLLALPVSAYEVALQLQHFARPRLQLRVVRILWMVPVYALNSWFALKYKVRWMDGGRWRERERQKERRRERRGGEKKSPSLFSFLSRTNLPPPSARASPSTPCESATRPTSSTTSSCTCGPTWRTSTGTSTPTLPPRTTSPTWAPSRGSSAPGGWARRSSASASRGCWPTSW